MDAQYFISDLGDLPEALIATLAISFAVILYLRVFGLKSFSTMSGYDFVNTLAIASVMATTAVTGKPSLVTGAAIVGMLFLAKFLVSLMRRTNKRLKWLVDNEPLLLMKDGKVLEENLKSSHVALDEIRAKLREAGVIHLNEVKAVVLETTGEVSVMTCDLQDEPDDFLLDDVCRDING